METKFILPKSNQTSQNQFYILDLKFANKFSIVEWRSGFFFSNYCNLDFYMPN